ncbi:DUF342 domain-containing protein [Oceanispirochaeta crateris]|uniref:DUF342 domain-containing protein n=1 Tax=Oceanispirochaeta crateris TaxID=2518645 RepID=A0A5C1QSV1_9SPIO|nr:FapA family protein [Oceanispirochaeta crateris]QEN09092.1 DUF342 domain-containing protein [Oceanispirochaeta crateris]
MSFEFNGKLSVQTDEKYLSAKIHFTPISSQESHNLASLQALLEKEGIVYGIDQAVLEKTAEEFSETMEPYLSDVIAKGNPPQGGTGQTYEFSPFATPKNLQTVLKKIMSMKKAPVIMKTISVKVTKDKRVKDKGLFKGGKEKIITVEEEEQKRIRVDVSDEVLDIGFFEKGAVICRMSSSTGEAKKGKDIRGNDLLPPEIIEGEFWPGKNIIKEKTEILAGETGFVRKGKNWLDLLPFENHSWSVFRSDNKADCLLELTAGNKFAAPPEVSEIKQAVLQLGVSQDVLVSDRKIMQFLGSSCRSGGTHTFCLTKDRDGSFDIEVNSLSTEAKLHLYKGSGKGRSLNLKQAWNRVLDLKIVHFEAERIKKEILDFHGSEDKETTILLAAGQDPRRGDDREILIEVEYLSEDDVGSIKDRIKELKVLAPSFKDFPVDKIEKMAPVKKGMKLFQLGKQKGGKDGRDIYGNIIQGIEGNDPILNIYENISIQDEVATSKINGILDFACDNMIYYLRVREHEDARIMVSLSDNSMTAYVSFLSPQGSGKPVSLESIHSVLEEKGIVKGILEDEIRKIVTLAEEGQIVTDYPVAEGKMPFLEEQTLKFLVDLEPGTKDNVPVDAGDLIAEIQKQGDGESTGYNVLGEQLYSENDKGLEREDNVLLEEVEGRTLLKSGTKGLLCLENGKLYIKEKQTIRGDISRTTGNLQFPGSIAISGSVLSGIFVKAGKDLTVMEVVEASLLSAGGSIIIGKGVKGDHKAVLRAGENITLGFAEATNIMVNGVLYLKKALMNCVIKCNGKIESDSGNTRIIGGHLKVKNGITVGSIGSESETKTYISFGQDYLVEDQINVVTKEIDQITQALPEIESHLKLAGEKRNQKKLMALRKKKVQMLKVLEKQGIKNFFLKEKFEIHFDSMIKVSNTVFPGVTFESHGRTYTVKQKLNSIIIYFDSKTGKILTKPLI